MPSREKEQKPMAVTLAVVQPLPVQGTPDLAVYVPPLEALGAPAPGMPPEEVARLAAPVFASYFAAEGIPVPARWRQSGGPLRSALADAITALVPS